jgi:hypothetical protein
MLILLRSTHAGALSDMPILDCNQSLLHRPVAWSSIDTIFAAHAHQPAVVRRVFPLSRTSASSTQSPVLPSHPPILSSPGAYEPPTIIVLKSTSDIVFAYFPGRSGDGLGCLWYRRPRLDSVDCWYPGPFWSVPRGDGVVAATWLGPPREASRLFCNAPLTEYSIFYSG